MIVIHGIVAWLDAYGIGASQHAAPQRAPSRLPQNASSRQKKPSTLTAPTPITTLAAPLAGANDVANSFGTSVGSKTLKLWSAVCIAAVFEFLGAMLLGGAVTRTIAGGIANTSTFARTPALFMLGMLTAETAAMIWLLVATYLELPVSTTHSIGAACLRLCFLAAQLP
jgi:phosphate/sulfate permease